MTVRLLGVAAAVLLAAGPGWAQDAASPQPPATPAPAAKLTGLEAWEKLKGNTIEGKSGGETYAEYFDAGGSVRYVDKDGLSTGTWSVQKDKVCFDFPDDDDRSCSRFEVTGDMGTSTDDDGTTLRFQIMPGNNRGL